LRIKKGGRTSYCKISGAGAVSAAVAQAAQPDKNKPQRTRFKAYLQAGVEAKARRMMQFSVYPHPGSPSQLLRFDPTLSATPWFVNDEQLPATGDAVAVQ